MSHCTGNGSGIECGCFRYVKTLIGSQATGCSDVADRIGGGVPTDKSNHDSRQKLSFNPSWTLRAPVADRTTPNAAVLSVVPGAPNTGVLVRPKNSPRICRR